MLGPLHFSRLHFRLIGRNSRNDMVPSQQTNKFVCLPNISRSLFLLTDIFCKVIKREWQPVTIFEMIFVGASKWLWETPSVCFPIQSQALPSILRVCTRWRYRSSADFLVTAKKRKLKYWIRGGNVVTRYSLLTVHYVTITSIIFGCVFIFIVERCLPWKGSESEKNDYH